MARASISIGRENELVIRPPASPYAVQSYKFTEGTQKEMLFLSISSRSEFCDKIILRVEKQMGMRHLPFAENATLNLSIVSTWSLQITHEPQYRYLRTSIQRRALFMKSSLVYQKWFCLVALKALYFEKHFDFGSDTSDYVTALNSPSIKTSIIRSSRDASTEQNFDVKRCFWKYLFWSNRRFNL